jgi:hypothetical protein
VELLVEALQAALGEAGRGKVGRGEVGRGEEGVVIINKM